MKTKILLIILISFLYRGYGQDKCEEKDKKKCNANTLKAKGQNITNSILEVKYGNPVYLEIEGVNTFLNKTYSTYKPINFDFSIKGFEEEKKENKDEHAETSNPKVKAEYHKLKISNSELVVLETKRDNYLETLSFSTLSNDFNLSINDEIEKLTIEIKAKEIEIERINSKLDSISKNNDILKQEIELLNKVGKSKTDFAKSFKKYQNIFTEINNYTSLKKLLLDQIKKATVFIDDVDGFKKRSESTFNTIYQDNIPLDTKKKLIVKKIDYLNELYYKLSKDYHNINEVLKKKKYEFKGEVKDGDNVLKFEKIEANLEIKYQFEDEMSKIKKINDSISLPKYRNSIIAESQEGIDLYDEIKNNCFKTTIASPFIYSDKADIAFELKNSEGVLTHKYNPLTVKTYWKLRVNGSAGYFLNFISDDNYGIRKKIETDPISKTGVNETNASSIKHSLGFLIHSYWDFKGDVDAGISVGLGINDSSNTSFYLGLSGLFLENNRLVFTAGLSYINVSRLNTSNLKYNSSNEYDFTNESDTEIKYDKIFKPSFFIGISYNLFKN